MPLTPLHVGRGLTRTRTLSHFPNFVNAIGGKAFAHGSAHYLEGYTGAALWLPPNVQPDDDDLFSLFQRTVAEELHKDVFAVFEQMGRYHPREPYWYLPLIGVDPSRQGQGYGSALMAHGIAPCDRNRTLAYLESSSPRNIPLYKRFGFEVIGTIQVGASPPIFPMLRKPRYGILDGGPGQPHRSKAASLSLEVPTNA